MNPSLKLFLPWPRDGRSRRNRRAAEAPRSSIGYRPSHRRFLTEISQLSAHRSALTLGCVFLPVSRSLLADLPGLRLATELAVAQGCHLIVSCSKRARPADFPADLAAELGDRLVLLNQADVHPDWQPELVASRQRASSYHRVNDASAKRNVALTLAAVLGWDAILFLDDDVHPLADEPTMDRGSLLKALAVLRKNPDLKLVGWSATDYADNSMIAHARRLLGLRQDVFIGAGAMLVRCDQGTSYFPNIYNHDWFFAISQALRSKRPQAAIGWAGNVGQVPYNPFQAKRARSEETGDLLGEGLLNLLEDRGPDFDRFLTKDFWERTVRSRRELIQKLKQRIEKQAVRDRSPEQTKAWFALDAAEKVNSTLKSQELADYVRNWRSDEFWWQKHLAGLTKDLGARPGPEFVLQAVRSGRSLRNRSNESRGPALQRSLVGAGTGTLSARAGHRE